MTTEELSEALARVEPGVAENPSPWYVQVMLGVCAWIAGLLLLLFLVITVVAGTHGESWGVLLTLGVMACAGSALMYRAIKETSAFGSQFALAMSIAGQTGVTVGMGGLNGPRAALCAMLAVEIAMIFAVRNRLHRVLVTGLAVMAWALAMHDVLFRDIPGISLFSRQHEVVYDSSALPVVLWTAMWAPIAYGAFWLVQHEAQWMAEGRERLLRPVMQGLVGGLSIAPLATHPSTFWMAMGMGPAQIVRDGSSQATALWPLLAMSLAILSVALAFTLRNRALMGLAILFALLEIGGFYYVLGTTLLVKSLIMIALGVALLGTAQVFAKEPAA